MVLSRDSLLYITAIHSVCVGSLYKHLWYATYRSNLSCITLAVLYSLSMFAMVHFILHRTLHFIFIDHYALGAKCILHEPRDLS